MFPFVDVIMRRSKSILNLEIAWSQWHQNATLTFGRLEITQQCMFRGIVFANATVHKTLPWETET